MNMIERARALRRKIEQMAENLTDEEAVDNSELYPVWDQESHEYKAGDRIRYNGELYKVLQNHSSQVDWSPETAAALFAKILPGQDGTEIGEWVQPDSTNAYSKGDRVIYDGKTYESLIDNNVWSPAAYPAGWKEV